MKRMFVISLLFFICKFCYGQHENDSIRYYSIIKYINENHALIKSNIKNKEEQKKYNPKKLWINENDLWKIKFLPTSTHSELQKYFNGLEGDELYLAIRKDYVLYTVKKDTVYNKKLLKEMNFYLDSVLRKGKRVDTCNSHWIIVFSDFYYNYTSIYFIFKKDGNTGYLLGNYLQFIFLFDDQNKIKEVMYGYMWGL